MTHNLFNTLRNSTRATAKKRKFYSLPQLEKGGHRQNLAPAGLHPHRARIRAAQLRRQEDHRRARTGSLRPGAPNGTRTEEIPFIVARILLQDFTGVPLLCDLAAMRGAAARMGKNPGIIEPLVPVDLVIDHSVQIDCYGSPDALQKNMEMEFKRNRERYEFLKWGMNAFRTLPGGSSGHRHRAPGQS